MSVTPFLIGAGVLLALGVWWFNALVARRNAVGNAFAGVDAYLAMRYDLIPNLVATVKAYAAHERETIARVTELRGQALAGGLDIDQRVRLDNRIAQGMSSLIAVAEANPTLHASHQFLQLQRALNEVEERLSAARRSFNACVLEYNNTVECFPSNLVAALMKFRVHAFFEVAELVREPVAVSGSPTGIAPASALQATSR